MLGSGPPADTHRGRPGGRGEGDGGDAARAAKAAELEPAALDGVGVGSPGVIEGGNVTSARNLPGWEGTFPLAAGARKRARVGGASMRSATTCRSRPTPSSSWAPGGPYELAARRLLGHRRRRRADPRRQALARPGRRRRDRAHGGGDRRRALHLRAARLHGGLRRARGDGEHARKLHEKGRQTDLFKLMKEHDRTRLTSGIWARALEHGDKLATS